ncbi:hypothetical protein GTR04_5730 [Trichophyton interdigitale]|nr:hypothetical protein GY631_5576 [Trichophyton interdigitale]KAG5218430.1 hypothetical protein GY632_5554 [Trichophyton interdigitale]KAG8206876.1 hypothetical protein GTR04_5730 [Trichophyton interdigitale]
MGELNDLASLGLSTTQASSLAEPWLLCLVATAILTYMLLVLVLGVQSTSSDNRTHRPGHRHMLINKTYQCKHATVSSTSHLDGINWGPAPKLTWRHINSRVHQNLPPAELFQAATEATSPPLSCQCLHHRVPEPLHWSWIVYHPEYQ